MGLLDGGLKSIIGGALSPVMISGTLHVPTKVSDDKGGYTTKFSDVPIRGFVENYSEAYLTRNAIPRTDVKIMVLQDKVPAEINVDCEITIRGVRYTLFPVEQDPAQATWTARGRPVSG